MPPPARAERFLLAIGVEGLCDRLQSLLTSINYCRTTGRTLVVSWNDAVWSGGTDEQDADAAGGFGDYFRVVGIKWAPRLPPELLESTDVSPPFWVGKLRRCGGAWLYQHRAAATFKWDAPCTARIAVAPNIGFRRVEITDLPRHVRLQPWLVHAWAARAARIARWLAARGRGERGYCAVHLRGLDRASKPKDAAATRKRFDALLERAASATLPIVVLSDDAALNAEWATARPSDLSLRAGSWSAQVRLAAGQGAHFASAGTLAKAGTSKRQLNRDAIVDWLTLSAGAQQLVLQPTSIFGSTARDLRRCPRGIASLMRASG